MGLVMKHKKVKNLKNRLLNISKKHEADKIWGLNRLFTYGQYKDCSLRDVIAIDLKYIKYMIDRHRLSLSKEAVEYLDEVFENEQYNHLDFNDKFTDEINFFI